MSTVEAPRTGRTPKDMVLSLVVLLVPLALLAAYLGFVREGDGATVQDPAPVIAQARAAGRFPVQAPTGLPEGWRSVSAVFNRADGGATLRIGYLTPQGDGVQFVMSDIPAEDLFATELGERPRQQGSTTVASRDWQRYAGRAGETALVLLEPGRSVIVLGRAPVEDLRTLAAAIR